MKIVLLWCEITHGGITSLCVHASKITLEESNLIQIGAIVPAHVQLNPHSGITKVIDMEWDN